MIKKTACFRVCVVASCLSAVLEQATATASGQARRFHNGHSARADAVRTRIGLAPARPARPLLRQLSQPARESGRSGVGAQLTLDDLDPARVSEHADKWELVVRKLRAG